MPVNRILIIEDDAETRILLRKGLEAAGLEVDAVWGGEKGLEAARSGLFGAVILDVMMPGMDGFEVLAALRADESTRKLPVIVLTARAEESVRKQALEAGASAFRTKPFQIAELVDSIRACLDASGNDDADE